MLALWSTTTASRIAARLVTGFIGSGTSFSLQICATGVFQSSVNKSAVLADAALGSLGVALQSNAHPTFIDALLCLWKQLSRTFAHSLFVAETAILGDVCNVVMT